MNTLKDFDDAGIELSAEQRELIAMDDRYSELMDDYLEIYRENVQLKERLADLDPDFGDLYYGSDRGNEMRNE